MEQDGFRRFAGFNVTLNGLADVGVQIVQRVGLGEDGVAQCAGGVSALGGFLPPGKSTRSWFGLASRSIVRWRMYSRRHQDFAQAHDIIAV